MNGSEFFGYWLRLKRKSLDLTREELAERVGNESSGDLCEMLVTIQEYAHERLRQSGEETEVHNWHLAYFLGVAEKADKELYGHNQLEWLKRLSATRDNLRAALDWAIETKQTRLAIQMARKLDWFWFIRSDHMEAAQSLLRVFISGGAGRGSGATSAS